MMNKNVIVKIKMPFLHIAHHLEKVNLNCNNDVDELTDQYCKRFVEQDEYHCVSL